MRKVCSVLPYGETRGRDKDDGGGGGGGGGDAAGEVAAIVNRVYVHPMPINPNIYMYMYIKCTFECKCVQMHIQHTCLI